VSATPSRQRCRQVILATPDQRAPWLARAIVGAIVLVALVSLFTVLQVPDDALAQTGQGLQGGWAVGDLGDVVFPHSLADQLPLIQQAGAGWVRINFRLGNCFQDWTTPGCNGQTALQVYDDVVGRVRAQNLQILGLLSNESWVGGQEGWVANSAEVNGGNGDNAYIRAFASGAAGTLARHFSDRISWWEVWNEPNAWTGQDENGNPFGATFLQPSNYAWLLKRSQAAIKAARGDAVVVSGGLLAHDQDGMQTFIRTEDGPVRFVRHGERIGPRRSPDTEHIPDASPGCRETRPSGAAYLCDVYTMGRSLAGWQSGAFPLDAIGVHLYVDQGRQTSSGTLATYLQDVRAVYIAFEGGGTGKRIDVTEAGWSTVFVDASVQAANAQTLYSTLRGTSYVDRGYWFNIQDIPEAGLFFGLADSDRRLKPAFTTYQQSAGGGGGPPAPTPVPTPTPQPTPGCSPRPPIGVQSAPVGNGRLAVTVTSAGDNNWLTSFRFTSIANGLVELPGQPPRQGTFNYNPPAGTTVSQFFIRRLTAGPTTVQLTITDRCGEWPSLVGGGPSSF